MSFLVFLAFFVATFWCISFHFLVLFAFFVAILFVFLLLFFVFFFGVLLGIIVAIFGGFFGIFVVLFSGSLPFLVFFFKKFNVKFLVSLWNFCGKFLEFLFFPSFLVQFSSFFCSFG